MIINCEDYTTQWKAGHQICIECWHEYVSVWPTVADPGPFECPVCHEMASVEVLSV